jgi:hypothetical protein
LRTQKQPNTDKRLAVDWTKHLPEEQKEEFEKSVRNSFHVLDRLFQIVEEKIAEVHDKESKEADYSSNSWAYLQAHRNGKIEGLKKVKDLLSFLT